MRADGARPSTPRFVFWFNGNGIPERYWIPSEVGSDYELTPCLAPLESLRNDIHVISGIDNPNAQCPRPGNTHHKSMSALVSGTAVHRPRRGRRVDRSGDRRRRWAASRGSARCRSASARNRTARTSIAT